MTIPYDYDQTNIDHLRVVIDEQEQTIKYLHERCKAEEVVNAKLRELAARAWGLFLKHGAVHPCDLPEVDAVRDELRKLGVEAGK